MKTKLIFLMLIGLLSTSCQKAECNQTKIELMEMEKDLDKRYQIARQGLEDNMSDPKTKLNESQKNTLRNNLDKKYDEMYATKYSEIVQASHCRSLKK